MGWKFQIGHSQLLEFVFSRIDSKGVFGFVFGFVFSTGANLKDFSGSFSGSFRLTCVAFAFVFNNFSASFPKIRYLFLFFSPDAAKIDLVFIAFFVVRAAGPA